MRVDNLIYSAGSFWHSYCSNTKVREEIVHN